MKEVHLTSTSIPGGRCLREMKASTNKRRRDTTYTSKMIAETGINKSKILSTHGKLSVCDNSSSPAKSQTSRGNRKAVPVRTAEETRHSMASSLEGKLKNHPAQCIPPNTMPTTGKKMIHATPTSLSLLEE